MSSIQDKVEFLLSQSSYSSGNAVIPMKQRKCRWIANFFLFCYQKWRVHCLSILKIGVSSLKVFNDVWVKVTRRDWRNDFQVRSVSSRIRNQIKDARGDTSSSPLFPAYNMCPGKGIQQNTKFYMS